MALSYDITSVFTINNQDVSVNAFVAPTVDGTAYDMAFVGFANFLSGAYTQDTSDVNTTKSNFTVSQAALNNAHVFYVSDGTYPHGGETTYGAGIAQTGTLFGSSAVTNIQLADDSVATLASIKPFGTEFIAMTNISSGTGEGVVISATETLAKGASSVGDALFQAVNAALFKKLGKSAAILNDTNLVASLNSSLYTLLSTEVDESTDTAYANSDFIKRYIDSGRYQDDNADIDGTAVDYNLNNVIMNMVVQIKGSVVDADDAPALASDSDAINRIFGTVDTDHLIDTVGAGTNTVGDYTITVLLSLKNDTRL
tara:strand:+ start:6495 stop:7433 length:939 start_codon:yes stop_codon:yes gene_type:complete